MRNIERVEVNGRIYRLSDEPVIVVCVDGSEPEYHRRAIDAGLMPFLASVEATGAALVADCAMPSFTNPNNVSIATGVPPAVHGICGNTVFDPEQGVEVMMNDPAFLRAETIFSAFEEAGTSVAVVTAKDKLRRLLGHRLTESICFSAEKADQVSVEENGITDVLDLVGQPLPSVYSAELSEFVMAAGVRILETRRPDLMYLTLTDYVQHKFAPGTPEANGFYAMLDTYLATLDALGATIVVTGDHGMNAKTSPDGSPQVVYLQELLDDWIGPGASHVVLPIADPYTRHHGSLGSLALGYLRDGVHGVHGVHGIAERLAALPGIAEVLLHDEACERFELPADRVGDLVVIANRNVALGTSPDRHDLSQLDRPLRSHGGWTEQQVPMIINRTLTSLPSGHLLRNFDAFWVGLNLAASSGAIGPVRRGR